MAGHFTDCGAMASRRVKIFAGNFWGKSLGMASKIEQEIHADNSAENSLGAQSLLELAEILDQHKIWVESGGESGTKADFCGVDLAHADLTGVNLQGAHLHIRQFHSDRANNENRAMVLFFPASDQRCVLDSDFHDHGSSADAKCFRDSASAHRQCATDDGFLLRRPAAPAFVLSTSSFFA